MLQLCLDELMEDVARSTYNPLRQKFFDEKRAVQERAVLEKEEAERRRAMKAERKIHAQASQEMLDDFLDEVLEDLLVLIATQALSKAVAPINALSSDVFPADPQSTVFLDDPYYTRRGPLGGEVLPPTVRDPDAPLVYSTENFWGPSSPKAFIEEFEAYRETSAIPGQELEHGGANEGTMYYNDYGEQIYVPHGFAGGSGAEAAYTSGPYAMDPTATYYGASEVTSPLFGSPTESGPPFAHPLYAAASTTSTEEEDGECLSEAGLANVGSSDDPKDGACTRGRTSSALRAAALATPFEPSNRSPKVAGAATPPGFAQVATISPPGLASTTKATGLPTAPPGLAKPTSFHSIGDSYGSPLSGDVGEAMLSYGSEEPGAYSAEAPATSRMSFAEGREEDGAAMLSGDFSFGLDLGAAARSGELGGADEPITSPFASSPFPGFGGFSVVPGATSPSYSPADLGGEPSTGWTGPWGGRSMFGGSEHAGGNGSGVGLFSSTAMGADGMGEASSDGMMHESLSGSAEMFLPAFLKDSGAFRLDDSSGVEEDGAMADTLKDSGASEDIASASVDGERPNSESAAAGALPHVTGGTTSGTTEGSLADNSRRAWDETFPYLSAPQHRNEPAKDMDKADADAEAAFMDRFM